MTTTGRISRLLAGAGAITAALRMADLVDVGLPRQWPTPARYAWSIGLLVLLLFGVGTVAQVLRSLFGEEVRWFPSRTELGGPQGLLRVLTVAGVLFAGIAAIGLLWPPLIGRAAMVGIGLFVIATALLRSRGFWNAPNIEGVRWFFGDRLVIVLYVLAGLAIVGLGIFL